MFEQAQDAREKILSAAEALFIERGFDGVSVNEVAVKAGVAKGLVFYHFENKQKLFDAVLDGYYKGQREALAAAFGAAGDLRARVRAGVDGWLDFVERNPGYPRLLQREICSSSRNNEKIMQYLEPLYQWGTMALKGEMPEEGPLSARQFFVSFFGLAINYYTYAPLLERLWKQDPLGAGALKERRAHVHSALEALMDKYLTDGRPAAAGRKTRGGK